MIAVKVTYYGYDGRVVVSSERGHTTLPATYALWQAQQLAHMLDAEFVEWGVRAA